MGTAALEQDKREFEEFTRKNDFWADTALDLYFSRVQAVTGEIGATMALWWRVRAEVSQSLTPESAGDALRTLLPEGTSQAIITMQKYPRVSLQKVQGMLYELCCQRAHPKRSSPCRSIPESHSRKCRGCSTNSVARGHIPSDHHH